MAMYPKRLQFILRHRKFMCISNFQTIYSSFKLIDLNYLCAIALCTDCNKDIKPEPAFRFTINTKPRGKNIDLY